jgi:vacuolar-type H+-ATPase subunit E/Vma4
MKGLEPVRAQHVAEQRARAEAIIASARATSRQMIAQAQADAQTMTAAARQEGQRSAELDTHRDWTAARRRARSIALSARREVYDELRALCADSIRADARYPDLQRAVADEAQKRLGPGSDVAIHGDFVTAVRRQRRIQWALDSTVDQSLRRFGGEVEALWR